MHLAGCDDIRPRMYGVIVRTTTCVEHATHDPQEDSAILALIQYRCFSNFLFGDEGAR